MIRHTVSFTLRHPPGSQEERGFLAAAQTLWASEVAVFHELDFEPLR